MCLLKCVCVYVSGFGCVSVCTGVWGFCVRKCVCVYVSKFWVCVSLYGRVGVLCVQMCVFSLCVCGCGGVYNGRIRA